MYCRSEAASVVTGHFGGIYGSFLGVEFFFGIVRDVLSNGYQNQMLPKGVMEVLWRHEGTFQRYSMAINPRPAGRGGGPKGPLCFFSQIAPEVLGISF